MRSRRIEKRVDPRRLSNRRPGAQGIKKAPALKGHFFRGVRVVNVVRSRDSDRAMRQLINRMNADIARRLPKAYEAAARGKAFDRACERVLADGVEDNIDPAADEVEIQDNRFGEVLAAARERRRRGRSQRL